MRRRRSAQPAIVFAAAMTAVVLGACGTESAVGLAGATTGARGIPQSASFLKQARLVSARWDRSTAARAWYTGLVLADGLQLPQIPGNAGFDSQRQKDMFWSGHFNLAVMLPSRSPEDVVRWQNGATLRLPVEDSRAAFRALATRTPCGGPYPCSQLGDLTVTGMQPGVVALPTSRGLAEVPAWRFSLAQLPWTFTQVAVRPGALVLLPGVGGLVGVSADGRTLRLEVAVPGGGCVGYPLPRLIAETYETSRTVVVGTRLAARPQATAPQVCFGVGLGITVHATLRRPLGARVVLDVGSGQPLRDPIRNGN